MDDDFVMVSDAESDSGSEVLVGSEFGTNAQLEQIDVPCAAEPSSEAPVRSEGGEAREIEKEVPFSLEAYIVPTELHAPEPLIVSTEADPSSAQKEAPSAGENSSSAGEAFASSDEHQEEEPFHLEKHIVRTDDAPPQEAPIPLSYPLQGVEIDTTAQTSGWTAQGPKGSQIVLCEPSSGTPSSTSTTTPLIASRGSQVTTITTNTGTASGTAASGATTITPSGTASGTRGITTSTGKQVIGGSSGSTVHYPAAVRIPQNDTPI